MCSRFSQNESTTTNDVCELIRLYQLTREMISNTKLSDTNVLFSLTVKQSFTLNELIKSQRNLVLEKLPQHFSLVNTIFTETSGLSKDEKNNNNSMQISMPLTALIRNLNRLTINNLFNRSHNPRANELIMNITKHITNHEVLTKGFIHPIVLFNAWAVYSKGKGHLGSQKWDPIMAISNSMLDAVELSFKGLKEYNFPICILYRCIRFDE